MLGIISREPFVSSWLSKPENSRDYRHYRFCRNLHCRVICTYQMMLLRRRTPELYSSQWNYQGRIFYKKYSRRGKAVVRTKKSLKEENCNDAYYHPDVILSTGRLPKGRTGTSPPIARVLESKNFHNTWPCCLTTSFGAGVERGRKVITDHSTGLLWTRYKISEVYWKIRLHHCQIAFENAACLFKICFLMWFRK